MVEQIKENYTLFFLRKKENFAIFLAQGVGFPSFHCRNDRLLYSDVRATGRSLVRVNFFHSVNPDFVFERRATNRSPVAGRSPLHAHNISKYARLYVVDNCSKFGRRAASRSPVGRPYMRII